MERQEAERLVETYSDLVLRLSYSYLNQTQDAQDICQTVFLKLLERAPDFVSSDHEKAWIIRTTANTCKDLLKSHWRRTTVAMEAASHIPAPELEEGSLSAAVNLLPPKYRAVIYLYYYEGYSSKEIARLLGRNPATVATQLRRGRTQLKDLLESEGSSSKHIVTRCTGSSSPQSKKRPWWMPFWPPVRPLTSGARSPAKPFCSRRWPRR